MTNTTDNNTIAIYQSDTGAISLRADNTLETIWATQKQMAELFDVNVRTINDHIQAIIKSDELDESVIRIFRITASDGKTYNTKHYNLDMIISVGYRVNSKQATSFRKWATSVLKDHITKGYTVNKELLDSRKNLAQQAIESIRLLAQNSALISKDTVLDLINGFTHTWFSLQRYDSDNLPKKGVLTQEITVSSDDLYASVDALKQSLIAQGEATPLFAQEKQQGSLGGILGNVMQNVFGEEVYPSIEEKASHLLYFIIKNHPFNDGNKRTGAFSFIWFLKQSNFEFANYITPNMLTALTLFIAESEPKYKDRIIGLVLELLRYGKSDF
jgi:prophage maintenance system killer protein